MKLIVCHKCHAVVAAEAEPMTFKHCPAPCVASSIAYTGEANEVAVSGPCTVIGMTDAEWESLLRPQTRRNMVQVISIMRDATTVIDLDAEEANMPPPTATHRRVADGTWFKLIETHPGADECVTLQELGTDPAPPPLTITSALLKLAFQEVI